MTCPRCKCPECRRVELQAVLARHVSRETETPVEQRNAAVIMDNQAREQWRDTFEPSAGRFVERRELGKPPVDPDAEQLASQVGALAGELERGAA